MVEASSSSFVARQRTELSIAACWRGLSAVKPESSSIRDWICRTARSYGARYCSSPGVKEATLAGLGICEQHQGLTDFQLNLTSMHDPNPRRNLLVKLFLRDRRIHDEHRKKQCEAGYDSESFEPDLHLNLVVSATRQGPYR